jgi:hypothetical protein
MTKARSFVSACLLLAALSAAGCGDCDDDDGADESAEETPEAAHKQTAAARAAS